MSAGRDAQKAWYGASLLDYTKLKKETESYVTCELIYTVARSLITQHGAYVWRAVAPQSQALVTCRHGAAVVSIRNNMARELIYTVARCLIIRRGHCVGRALVPQNQTLVTCLYRTASVPPVIVSKCYSAYVYTIRQCFMINIENRTSVLFS